MAQGRFDGDGSEARSFFATSGGSSATPSMAGHGVVDRAAARSVGRIWQGSRSTEGEFVSSLMTRVIVIVVIVALILAFAGPGLLY